MTTLSTQISPIHYCDNNINEQPSTSTSTHHHQHHHHHQLSVDEKNTAVIRISSFEEASSSLSSSSSQNILQKQQQQHQLSSLDPSSAYQQHKTSKIRRTEYSMRGIKIGCSNPSQDSAFGSMTDGELSRASSFKLSSFQSVSSPIDEGVEDICEDQKHPASLKYIDSSSSCSPCPGDNFTQSLNDLNIPGPSASPNQLNPLHVTNIKETCIYLDPPKLIVNDHSTIYTSSPIRKCATTEVFSQKYRVSSFEDMANSITYKKPYRSFEEEQRIESAFTPVRVEEQPIRSFSLAGMTGKERSTLWKDSFLKCNKNNLTIKSNESIYDKIENEEMDSSVSVTTPEISSSRRNRSDRLLFFKQNAIIELDTLSDIGSSSKNTKQSSNSCSSSNDDESNIDNTTITSTTNDDCNSDDEEVEECSSLTESLLKTSSSHDDFRKFVKSFDSDTSHSLSNNGEEKTPLLDGIEMLSITSSTEN